MALGIYLSCITIPLIPSFIILISAVLGTFYTGYKLAEHEYAFFKAKKEQSISHTETPPLDI